MKVPEPRSSPRLYTIPPSAPFLTTLARAILSGDLPLPGGPKPDPLTLPLTTIHLPTRRAARGLREAFLAEAGGAALLLPRIHALGDPDEEAAIIFGAEGSDDADGALGAPAIGALPRRLALMRLIGAWSNTPAAAATEAEIESVRWVNSPGQASSLAADLARLMDFVETEGADFSGLDALVPENLASHWEATVEFLKIVTKHWPQYLADNGLVSPVTRRNLLMAQEAERLARGSPYPVIAAGSTGTVPATARLLAAIASLPNGAVVLPGLDISLDDESWASLAAHPEHPQTGMAELLRKLGAERRDVAYVAGSTPDGAARARLHLVSEALRPAETTDAWQRYLEADALAPEGRASFANALAGIRLVEAPTAHDEAEAIALILRSCIETPGKTAALVTPDRVLARRVAARLKGFGLSIDDSAGIPVARTVPGAFLDLVLGAAETDFAPPELMALLKHPLVRLGREPAEIRAAARALERGVFRDIYVGQGLDGIAKALFAARGARKRRPLRLTQEEHDAALGLVRDLERAFAPLAELFASPSPQSASLFAKAHATASEALARDATGSTAALWQEDAGEALTVLLAELISEGEGLHLSTRDYPAFYRSLLAGQVIRPRAAAHPRLFIWGPLEARLQHPDVVILGSLNEGVWPRPQEAGPWLSRPMRDKLGLSPPERRTGLSAHDFAQALGAPSVYLTRALKVEGVPTVPSRWLQRLQALVEASGLTHKIKPQEPWVAWARLRDQADGFRPAEPPKPCPPANARPRELSVTRIERWIANPYEIFAKNILKLEPLKPLGAEPDAAMRGSIVHEVLSAFAQAYPDSLPDVISGELMATADDLFAKLGGAARVEAFWRPHFQRFAKWFAATEPQRRAAIARTHAEVNGARDITPSFRLRARADRIDVTRDGGVVIYDYKTGKPPLATHVDDLYAPQLSLEAAIAEAGGFADIGERAVRELRYIRVSGRDEGGEERLAGTAEAHALAATALESLTRLIAHFADTETPYEVKRRAAAAFRDIYRYDEYEHLARVKEWLTQEAEEDWR
ncbi:MAG: double-strand break repair protein AddB [Methyloceanibacter sp.]|uniref:double-strand break repair protein AddB n=1 Tax=Methyloceanibacter sp. TaxID=1965321 RepID=UPI003D6D2299